MPSERLIEPADLSAIRGNCLDAPRLLVLSLYIMARKGERSMDEMTPTELIVWLETLAENIELKAKTGTDAAAIIRDKITTLKSKT